MPPSNAALKLVDLRDIKVAIGVDPPNGIAILPIDGKLPSVCTVSSLTQLDRLLRKFMAEFTVIICGYEFAVLANRATQAHHAKTAAVCLQAIGVVEAACGQFLVPMIGVSAQGAKHAATGNRSASKEQVRDAMTDKYKVYNFNELHESDALAIADVALDRFIKGKGTVPT